MGSNVPRGGPIAYSLKKPIEREFPGGRGLVPLSSSGSAHVHALANADLTSNSMYSEKRAYL